MATNIDAKAQAGPFGVIALGFYNRPAARYEMRCARIGVGDASDGLLKALTWYRLDSAGEFIETT
ncbi:MAG: hypothetical protein Q8T13_23860 [Acidobacteriota bacterium]|nr:hypothetical protein [Acidobacteriota bacterium]